ncbi:MAG: hypothetical protein FJZ95_02960, partial [Chloroflexi bacterium]|nr:hypothetical protein [Chloroflexota bacterium]
MKSEPSGTRPGRHIVCSLGILILLSLVIPISGPASADAESAFEGNECGCPALIPLGWTADDEGLVLGCPGNRLMCLYSRKDQGSPKPYYDPLWMPTTAEMNTMYYDNPSTVASDFAEYADAIRGDIQPQDRLIELEDDPARISHLTQMYSLYSGRRVFYVDRWIVTITVGGPDCANDAEFIAVFDALEACARAAISGKKPGKEATVSGTVEDGHAHPLDRVEVQLFWDFDDGMGPVLIGSDWTDEKGRYSITGPDVRVPMPKDTQGFLRVNLLDERGTIEVYDESVDPNTIVYCEFGDVPRTAAARSWFEINDATDLQRNLVFPMAPTLAARPPDMLYDPGHSDDAAITYYYAHIAVKFYRDFLGVTFGPGGECDHIPLPIRTWAPAGTDVFCGWANVNHADGTVGWRDPFISMEAPGSAWDDPGAPKNREFHEFSHYVMQDVYDGMQDWLRETADVNSNGVIDQDSNHAGYFDNNLSTTDSWQEGFAEFMGCVIAEWASSEGYRYQNDDQPAHHYPVGTGWHVEEARNIDLLEEELCVASILWDVYDDANFKAERDNFHVPIDDLWAILTSQEFFPAYWELDPSRSQLSGWKGDEYARGTASTETELRYISCVKDLYDALVKRMPEKKAAIDDIFGWHDVWVKGELFIDRNRNLRFDPGVDLWLQEFDLDGNGEYTGPNAPPPQTSEPPPTTVSPQPVSPQVYEDFEAQGRVPSYVYSIAEGSEIRLEASKLALYSGDWGLSVQVNTRDSAAVMIEKAMNLTGNEYLWLWANAPANVEFELQVADDEGLWISPKLKGRGVWDHYAVAYSAMSPHPLNASLSGGINRSAIQSVTINFTSPGSYTLLLDYITGDTPAPEEVPVEEPPPPPAYQPPIIYGIGSAERAYRRRVPVREGSSIRVSVDKVPATLQIDMDFGPPYDALDFSYKVEITAASEEINVY